MVDMDNDSVRYWNDEAGPRWVRVQSVMDAMLADITGRMLEASAIRTGERVLDVGCGCGTTTLAFAEAVGPAGEVLGVDVSGPMLRHASDRARDVGHLDLLHADAGSHEFDRGWADLVASRFGVMFFADPPKAFANLRAGMKDDGRMLAVVWQSPKLNPWATFLLRAFPEVQPSSSMQGDEDAPGPFRMADPDKVHRLLAGAGFGALELEDVRAQIIPGSTVDDAMFAGEQVGPFARLLAEAPPERHEALRAQAREFLEEQYRDGAPALDAAMWFIHGRA